MEMRERDGVAVASAVPLGRRNIHAALPDTLCLANIRSHSATIDGPPTGIAEEPVFYAWTLAGGAFCTATWEAPMFGRWPLCSFSTIVLAM